MRRILTALSVGGVLAAAVFGAAASLGGLFNTELSADDAVVVSCEGVAPDGVFVDYETALSFLAPPPTTNVIGVELTGFADGCLGQTATVVLNNGAGGTTTGFAPIIDNTPAIPHDNVATIAFAAPMAASAVTGIHVTVEA